MWAYAHFTRKGQLPMVGYFRNNDSREEVIMQSRETVQEIMSYPILAIPERGLSEETCRLFGVRSALSPKDGETVVAHYFPSYDQSGKVTGFKKRDLTLPKKQKGHFSTIGYVSTENMLFGQNVCLANDRPRKALYLVEGEYDTMSVHEDCVESVKGTKWEGKLVPFVCSINSGTASAKENCVHNEGFIKSFNKLVLGFDNDKSTKKGEIKGLEATEEVATSLLHPETYVVQFPEDKKDPNEVLLSLPKGTLQKLFSFADKRFCAEKVISSSDVNFEDVIKPRVKGIEIEALPALMRKTGGPRLGELWVITGPSGCGKTEFCSEITYSAFKAGGNVGLIMLEEMARETIQRFMAKNLGVNFNKFKNNPLEYHTKEQLLECKREFDESGRLHLVDHFGSMPISSLLTKIKNLVFVHGAQYILLDHLSMVISGLPSNDERKDIDMAMTEIAAFCAANPVWIGVVNHLNRSAAEGAKRPKNLEEGETFWINVTKEMLRGSGTLEQLPWMCLGLEPEVLPNKERGLVRINVMKNRPWGYLGIADTFKMCEMTGKIIVQGSNY